jgi:ankyrin repeat protein
VPGIDVNIRDSQGKTPLHYAAQANDLNLITALMSMDSLNVSLKDLSRVHFSLRELLLIIQRRMNWPN